MKQKLRIWQSGVLVLLLDAGLGAFGCATYFPTGNEPDASDFESPDGSSESSENGPDQSQTEGEFCQGGPKVLANQVLYNSIVVTTEELMMNCCTGASLRYHLSGQTDMDLVQTVRFVGGVWEPGEYQLGNSAGIVESTVYLDTGPDCCQNQIGPLMGTLKISRGGAAWETPTMLSSCGWVSDKGPMLGTRVLVDNIVVIPLSWWKRWSIWLLQDPNITAQEAAKVPLESLVLSTEPIIDLGSISFYAWESHILYWGSWNTSAALRNRLPQVSVFGLPFVLRVDDAPIYLGAFHTSVSSAGLDMPVIMIDDPPLENDRMAIEPRYGGSNPGGIDVRADSRIRAILTTAAKLAP